MSFFEASCLIVFFASVSFGLVIYSHDRTSSLGRTWLLFSITTAIWSFSLYKVVTSDAKGIAFFWQSILDITGIFIPVFYFLFISTFLKLKNRFFAILVFVFAVLFSIFSISAFFKKGVVNSFGFYWVDPGDLYFLFPIFFVALVAYSVYILLSVYKTTTDQLLKNQIRYHVFAAIVGFGGGSLNFSPQLFGIFYPFGNYFLLLYLFFLSYSILQYQLFNVKVIATELFVGGVIVLFLFNFLISTASFSGAVINLFVFIAVTILGLLVVRSVTNDVKTKERIEGLIKDLAKANEHLRQMEQQKSEFVSIASHQLRTPLTAIKGYASMILEGSFGTLSNQAKDAVEKLFKSSQRLVGLVEDFLTVSRIERGKMQFDFAVVNLKDLIKDVIKDFEADARDRQIILTFQAYGTGPYEVRGDQSKLRQVMVNLLDNAFKFTNRGFVRILLTPIKDSKKLRIAISDTGVGMDFKTISRLFKRYDEELSSNRGEKTGMSPGGLGLYVSHQIVKAHGGKIWAESEGLGSGSTFFIELPAQA